MKTERQLTLFQERSNAAIPAAHYDEYTLGQTSIVAPSHAREEVITGGDGERAIRRHFEQKILLPTGQFVPSKCYIQTLTGFGSTTYFDDRVLIACFNLALQAETSRVQVKIAKFVRQMGEADGQRVRDRILESLARLHVTFMYNDTWVDRETSKVMEGHRNFIVDFKKLWEMNENSSQQVIPELQDTVRDEPQRTYKNEFIFQVDEQMFNSCEKNGVIFDQEHMRGLKSEKAERLFRHLNIVFTIRSEIELPMEDIRNILDIKKGKYLSTTYARIGREYLQNKMALAGIISHEFDRKKDIYKDKDGLYWVKIKRGVFFQDHYESLRTSGECPYMAFFKWARVYLGLDARKAHDIVNKVRQDNSLVEELHWLLLCSRVTPNQIKNYYSYFKKSVEELKKTGKARDYTKQTARLDAVLAKSKRDKNGIFSLWANGQSKTQYQLSWDKKDYNTIERNAFAWCNKHKISPWQIQDWLKSDGYAAYISNLEAYEVNLTEAQRRPGWLVTVIGKLDPKVFMKVAKPGSTHAKIRELEREGVDLEKKKEQARETYTSAFSSEDQDDGERIDIDIDPEMMEKSQTTMTDLRKRLIQVKALYEDGLLEENEYTETRAAIIQRLSE